MSVPSILFKDRKKDFIFLVIVAILFLGYSFYTTSRRPSPKTQPDIPPFSEALNPLVTVDISPGFSPTIPATLPTYLSTYPKTDIIVTATQLATLFRLTKSSSTNFWTNSDQSKYIYLSSDLNLITYIADYRKLNSIYTGSQKPSLESARSAALQISQEFLPNINLSIEENSTSYFKSSLELVPSTDLDYDLIRIHLSQTVDGFRLRRENLPLPLLSVTIGQNNQPIRIDYNSQVIDINQKQNNVSPYSLTEIISKLRQKEFDILEIQSYPYDPTRLRDITKLTVNDLIVEYRQINNQLIPFFNITASVQSSNGTPAQATISLPAIKTIPN